MSVMRLRRMNHLVDIVDHPNLSHNHRRCLLQGDNYNMLNLDYNPKSIVDDSPSVNTWRIADTFFICTNCEKDATCDE